MGWGGFEIKDEKMKKNGWGENDMELAGKIEKERGTKSPRANGTRQTRTTGVDNRMQRRPSEDGVDFTTKKSSSCI